MITFKAKDFDYSGTKDRIEGECLSTDTKPTKYANGSCLIEMDTGNRFMFDEANGEWLNITNPGGGGDAEVWFTGTLEEGGYPWFSAELTKTDKADVVELLSNYNSYSVKVNTVEVTYREGDETGASFDDTEGNIELYISNTEGDPSTVDVKGPTSITSVEVSVKAK